ncbi:MAG: UTP--glucose-1-phosphate uridylyltransferase [Micropruina sp.]
MSELGLRLAEEKMRAAEVSEETIHVFAHYYRQLEQGTTGLIREDTIEPLVSVDALADAQVDEETARRSLDQTVLIRLNGGLASSMGMDRAKSLLPVRDGRSFLDLIVAQVRYARRRWGVRLPLLLMNSFRTREDCVEALAGYPDLAVDGLPLDFIQNREPKLLVDSLEPATWPANPGLEWCPPGHGDIYTALISTGLLEALLERGFRYANSANADNLGAAPNAALAGWFASTGAPYAPEVCLRTPADRKGGHLAIRRADGRIILRDTAQTAPEEMEYFTSETRHPFFHTNNLWFDLEQLHKLLIEREGILGLPLIRNQKTVDPADPSTPAVYQIETAIGAAVEAFEGVRPILVDRSRFLPVKTTNDLLLVRSDAYRLTESATLETTAAQQATIDLDPRYYRNIADFEARFPAGAPSVAAASSLTVRGDWTFGPAVVALGDAVLDGAGGTVPAGARLQADGYPDTDQTGVDA